MERIKRDFHSPGGVSSIRSKSNHVSVFFFEIVHANIFVSFRSLRVYVYPLLTDIDINRLDLPGLERDQYCTIKKKKKKTTSTETIIFCLTLDDVVYRI